MSAFAFKPEPQETNFIARLAKAFARNPEAYRPTAKRFSPPKEAANWDAPPHWLRRD